MSLRRVPESHPWAGKPGFLLTSDNKVIEVSADENGKIRGYGAKPVWSTNRATVELIAKARSAHAAATEGPSPRSRSKGGDR